MYLSVPSGRMGDLQSRLDGRPPNNGLSGELSVAARDMMHGAISDAHASCASIPNKHDYAMGDAWTFNGF